MAAPTTHIVIGWAILRTYLYRRNLTLYSFEGIIAGICTILFGIGIDIDHIIGSPKSFKEDLVVRALQTFGLCFLSQPRWALRDPVSPSPFFYSEICDIIYFMEIYDLIIIGAGPSGATAGIYAKNFGINFLIIGEEVGGLLSGSYKVDNYPGIFDITGEELTKRFKKHLDYLEISLKKERIEKIEKAGKDFKVFSDQNEYQTKAIILAFGTEVKKIDIKNIDKFESKGVYYQSSNNISLFKDKIVAVVGGGNSAAMRAAMFAEQAKKVYLIYRKNKLRADKIWVDKIKKIKNIKIIYNTNVVETKGKNKLEEIFLDNEDKLKIESLFIEAGGLPNIELIKNLRIKTNELGYIEVDKCQATNVKGIFAAGDITTGSNCFRQIITACSEGAVAVLGVFNYLKKK